MKLLPTCPHPRSSIHRPLSLPGTHQKLNMFQVTGNLLGNGFQAPGRGCGSLATMIAGEIGWPAIMKITKVQDATWTEEFGSKDITDKI
jgi:hypothetical protein